MTRIQIDLPDTFIYNTCMTVRVGDLSYANHLGNHVLVSYLNEALHRFLRDNGCSPQDVGEMAFINTDLVVVFQSECIQGDALSIALAVAEPSKHGCRVYFRLTNQRTGKDAAKAHMTILFFDYGRKKVARIPQTFAAVLEQYGISSA